jgi:hypothetical protein
LCLYITTRTVVTIAATPRTEPRTGPAIVALSPALRPVECVGTTGGELDVVKEKAAVVVGLEGVKIVETVSPIVPIITTDY